MSEKKKRDFPPVGVSNQVRSQAGPRVGGSDHGPAHVGCRLLALWPPHTPSDPANLVMEVTAVVPGSASFTRPAAHPRSGTPQPKQVFRAAETSGTLARI